MNQDSINGVGWFPIEQPNFLQIDGTRTNPQIIPNFKPFTLFQQYVHPTKRRTCPLLPKLPKFAQKNCLSSMYRPTTTPFLFFNTDVNSSGSCGIGVVALQQPRVQPQQPQTNGCPSPPTSVTSNVPLLGVESHQPLPVQQQPPQTRNASATTAAAPASCKETSLSQHP